MSPRKQSITNMRAEMTSAQVRDMFDRVASKYDLLNHLLSLGSDIIWRRRLARSIETGRRLTLVDLATGTGDMLIAALNARCSIERAIGIDTSEAMLEICSKKLKKNSAASCVELKVADVTSTDLPSDMADVVTMGFGIRNTHDVPVSLSEIYRILKPNGMAMILEFSMPKSRIIRPLYTLHLRYLVPLMGSLISGNRLAYQYLDRTIETFYNPDEFCFMMKQAGFLNISATPLTFGVASIYLGSKSG